MGDGDESATASLGDDSFNDESTVNDVANEIVQVGSGDHQDHLIETTANVSSTIMLKVPTSNLAQLREIFEAGKDGLNLRQFLKAFISNMQLESDEELLKIIPDLVDFFNLVDINGDEHMEWSEFVMFVIEQVIKGSSNVIYEKFENVCRHPIQPASSRSTVKCSKYIYELNKMIIGVGSEIQIFDTEEGTPNMVTPGLKIKLKKKEARAKNDTETLNRSKHDKIREPVNNRAMDTVQVLDMVYIGSIDLLVIVRSDFCFEFMKFTSRTKLSAEFITHFGLYETPRQYNRIVIRDRQKDAIRLFAVGTNEMIDTWTINNVGRIGPVILKDLKHLERHLDFVMDILTIQNDMYNLLVSGGLDKMVHIWDLHSLQHKTTRSSGLTAGIQCLAFDGRSILFAGSYDHNIVGYDLDAEIDKPLFSLYGHSDTILKIVSIGRCDRAFSLCAKGEIKFWDISRSSTTDKEERLIDTVFFTEDHTRSFDVIERKSSQFPTMHGFIVCAQGRGQHVYKILDTSIKESAPLNAYYSVPLMMVITTHAKDVLFWNIITGDEQAKLDNLGSVYGDVLVSIMDNRDRKLVTGDSSGTINQYNCLNGAKLKQFPPLPSAVRFLLYSPDRTIIAVSGAGDIFIHDDLKNDEQPVDSLMRECRSHDVDIIAIAYSYPLGLIASADCKGNVVVVDYQYMSVETVIKDFIGTEIGQLLFLDPYPLLLIADNYHNFTIIPVGPAATYGNQRKLWSVTTVAKQIDSRANKPVSFMQHLGLESATGSVDAPPFDNSRQPTARPASPGRGKTASSSSGAHITAQSSKMSVLTADSSVASAVENTINRMGTGTGGTGAPSSANTVNTSVGETVKPGMSYRKMRRYLQSRNEIKCMTLMYTAHKPPTTTYMTDFKIHSTSLDNPSTTTATASEYFMPQVNPDEASYASYQVDNKEVDESMKVILGHEDGTISVVDLTNTLMDIGLNPLKESEFVYNQSGYDPRKTAACKYILQQYSELERVSYTPYDLVNRAEYLDADMISVFSAHKSPVHSMVLIGDDNDIITSGEDCCVNLFTVDGTLKGCLTRGREVDQLFKPRWKNPINMKKRDYERKVKAADLIQKLHLKRIKNSMNTFYDPFVDSNNPRLATTHHGEERLKDKREIVNLDTSFKTKLMMSTLIDEHQSNVALEESKKFLAQIPSPESARNNLHSSQSARSRDGTMTPSKLQKEMENHELNYEDKFLVLDQLRGKVNYDLSAKDMAATAKLAKELTLKEKEDEKARKVQTAQQQKHSASNYLNELMRGCELVKENKRNIPLYPLKGKKQVRTKFEIEIEKINLFDEKNWEINSNNRQRQLYVELYTEMDKYRLTNNPMRILESKMRELLPKGVENIYDFVTLIQKQRRQARKAAQEQLKLKLERDQAIELKRSQSTVLQSLSENGQNNSTSTEVIHPSPVRVKPPPLWQPKFDSTFEPPVQTLPGVAAPLVLNPLNPLMRIYDNKGLSLSNGKEAPSFKVRASLSKVDSSTQLPVLSSSQSHNLLTSPAHKKVSQSLSVTALASNVLFKSFNEFPFANAKDESNAKMQRSATLEALQSFENSMKNTDKMFKRARREGKKMKKQLRKQARLNPELDPIDPHTLRHMGTKMQLSQQGSVEGLLMLGHHKMIGDENVTRKMNYALQYKSTLLTSVDDKTEYAAMKKKKEHDKYESSDRYNHNHSIYHHRNAKHSHTELHGLLHESRPVSAGGDKDGEGNDDEEDDVQEQFRIDNDRNKEKLKPQQEAYDIDEAEENENVDSLSLSLNVGSVENLTSVLKDVNDKTALYLVKLLSHKLIVNRPQYLYALMKLLKKRVVDHKIHKNEVTVSLTEVLYHLRPYMTEKEKINSNEFLKENIEYQLRKAEKIKQETGGQVSVEELEILRALFSFFDKDKSGEIDHSELAAILRVTLMNRNKKGSFISTKSSGDYVSDMNSAAYDNRELDDQEIARMIESVDVDRNNMLNFDEFVMLFKNTLIPS